MGKIRQTYVKRLALRLLAEHPDAFTSEFEYNKAKIEELKAVQTKSLRNRVAGYITHMVKPKPPHRPTIFT